ncbi:hypothetical protein QQZ08_007820 [Neonectria magnoliae]|uniref:Uncharacterized protein n=1 Tax=Neonectria magnoliae TaxID=2732573 RepID=A0ABR1HXE6_9HYPO
MNSNNDVEDGVPVNYSSESIKDSKPEPENGSQDSAEEALQQTEDDNYNQYESSLAGAIVFIIGFSVSSTWHIYQIFKTKTWFFIPFLNRYSLRAIGAKQSPDYTFGPYVLQNLFLLLGSTCYAASIYMILGRLIRLLDADKFLLIWSSWLIKFFLFGDVLFIALQAPVCGGKLVNADTPDDRSSGEKIIIGGLVVQVLFFSLFMAITCLFHYRARKNPTARISSIDTTW